MLPNGHPHAWNVARAAAHLPGAYTHRNIATGGHLVVTAQMGAVAAGMPSVLDRGGAVAISGPYGSGKSTLLEAVAAVADVNTAIATLPRRATERAQWEEIATAVIGTRPKGTARDLMNATRDYLRAVPTLLIIDEAQFLGDPELLSLRWLWTQPYPRFAIVFAGTDLLTHLQKVPSVETRIDRRIELGHHTWAKMHGLLIQHHPTLAGSDPDLLAAIDREYAHGSWRAWSKLLLTFVNDLRRTGPITAPDAAAVIHAITGTAPTLTVPPATTRRRTRR